MTYNKSTENCTQRGDIMIAVNYSGLRENMKACLDMVSDDYETLVVTRKKNRNVVIISEEAYNNLMENAYLRADSANLAWLTQSKAQLENGKCSVHELMEADDE